MGLNYIKTRKKKRAILKTFDLDGAYNNYVSALKDRNASLAEASIIGGVIAIPVLGAATAIIAGAAIIGSASVAAGAIIGGAGVGGVAIVSAKIAKEAHLMRRIKIFKRDRASARGNKRHTERGLATAIQKKIKEIGSEKPGAAKALDVYIEEVQGLYDKKTEKIIPIRNAAKLGTLKQIYKNIGKAA